MNKNTSLEKVNKEIIDCKVCKQDKSGKAVPGEGDPNAKVVFIGEAPGRTEAQTGRPFVGRSGKFLRTLINEVGLKEEEVFITSPVKYLPDRGTPTPIDIEHGRIHLQKQVDIINPKIIVLLGGVATLAILEEKIPVKKRHGEIISKNDRKYLITLHPAAGIRFPPLKTLIIEDFKKLKSLVS